MVNTESSSSSFSFISERRSSSTISLSLSSLKNPEIRFFRNQSSVGRIIPDDASSAHNHDTTETSREGTIAQQPKHDVGLLHPNDFTRYNRVSSDYITSENEDEGESFLSPESFLPDTYGPLFPGNLGHDPSSRPSLILRTARIHPSDATIALPHLLPPERKNPFLFFRTDLTAVWHGLIPLPLVAYVVGLWSLFVSAVSLYLGIRPLRNQGIELALSAWTIGWLVIGTFYAIIGITVMYCARPPTFSFFAKWIQQRINIERDARYFNTPHSVNSSLINNAERFPSLLSQNLTIYAESADESSLDNESSASVGRVTNLIRKRFPNSVSAGSLASSSGSLELHYGRRLPSKNSSTSSSDTFRRHNLARNGRAEFYKFRRGLRRHRRARKRVKKSRKEFRQRRDATYRKEKTNRRYALIKRSGHWRVSGLELVAIGLSTSVLCLTVHFLAVNLNLLNTIISGLEGTGDFEDVYLKWYPTGYQIGEVVFYNLFYIGSVFFFFGSYASIRSLQKRYGATKGQFRATRAIFNPNRTVDDLHRMASAECQRLFELMPRHAGAASTMISVPHGRNIYNTTLPSHSGEEGGPSS